MTNSIDKSVLNLFGEIASCGEVRSYVNGQFLESTEEPFFVSVDPATEHQMAQIQVASATLVNQAVSAARQAFDHGPWPRMRPAERAAYLFEFADIIESRLSEIAHLETRDTGLPILFTKGGHIPKAVSQFRYFAEEAMRLIGDAYSLDSAYINIAMREPIGVVAIITPWNAPLAVASSNLAAALATGNCCVLKPSEEAPLSSAFLAEVAAEAGLPPGVLNVVFGPGCPTGTSLVSHPDVDFISFTGSTETGEHIMAQAATGFKRLGLETGGKSANIIFKDADLDAALDGAVLSIFANNGEVCAAGSRILVERACYEDFVAAFADRARNIRVADPTNPTTELGPLISANHLHWVTNCIESGQAEGAQLVCGGMRPEDLDVGYFIQPAVIADVDNRMRIAQVEVFGPVATVIPFDGSEESAVWIANESRFGLAAYVWSGDCAKALRVARGICAGMVAVNSPFVRDPRAPFGGYKSSGYGRTGGRHSIELFTELKTTCLPVNSYTFPQLGMK